MMFSTAALHLGGTVVVMPRFDADEACRLVEAERCRSMFLVPPMAEEMVAANDGGKYDLSSLRMPAGSDAWNAMTGRDESPWARAFAGYGQTEVGGMLTYAGFGIGGIGSFGRPSPLVHVRILGPDGLEVEPGEVGEIVARGLHVAMGYHGRPELQARRQAGGWHHTGDLGRREADGTLSFIGPRGRLIKSAAENIYPAEVERVLATHAAVGSCAVIGVPDARWGQSVMAIVVPADGLEPTDATAEELIEHCRSGLASYKKPRAVTFVDQIPRQGFAPDYDALDAEFGGGGYPGT
jgi:long-chain acyl-CoA synthetase